MRAMATELRYCRPLADGPRGLEAPVAPGARVRAPQTDEMDSLHEVYLDAFSTRPGACLERSVWIPKWPQHPLCVLGLSVVVVTGDALAGYLLAYVDEAWPGDGIIGQVGVRTAFRRQGVARRLISTAMLGFADCGLRAATLHVAPGNTTAIRLYEQLGFAREP